MARSAGLALAIALACGAASARAEDDNTFRYGRAYSHRAGQPLRPPRSQAFSLTKEDQVHPTYAQGAVPGFLNGAAHNPKGNDSAVAVVPATATSLSPIRVKTDEERPASTTPVSNAVASAKTTTQHAKALAPIPTPSPSTRRPPLHEPTLLDFLRQIVEAVKEALPLG